MQQHETTELMIMLSTQQQIVNYKTFKHYNPRRVVALCSESAKRHNWCYGFQSLLRDRFSSLAPCEDTLMDVIKLAQIFANRLEKELRKATGTIVWAWAGAQKPHSAALYLLARQYKEAEPDRHVIVYADGNSNALYLDGQDEKILLNLSLSAEEVLEVHGLQRSTGHSPYTTSTPQELRRFLTDQQVRIAEWQPPPFVEAFYRLAEGPALSRDEVVRMHYKIT